MSEGVNRDGMERVFEKAMDGLGDVHPEAPAIILGVVRLSNDGDARYPVVAGARSLDALGSDPIELGEMVLSLIRSVKKMCVSIAPEAGGELFDFVCTKAVMMEDDEDERTTIEEREWSRKEGSSEKDRTMGIEDMAKGWKDFLK